MTPEEETRIDQEERIRTRAKIEEGCKVTLELAIKFGTLIMIIGVCIAIIIILIIKGTTY